MQMAQAPCTKSFTRQSSTTTIRQPSNHQAHHQTPSCSSNHLSARIHHSPIQLTSHSSSSGFPPSSLPSHPITMASSGTNVSRLSPSLLSPFYLLHLYSHLSHCVQRPDVPSHRSSATQPSSPASATASIGKQQ